MTSPVHQEIFGPAPTDPMRPLDTPWGPEWTKRRRSMTATPETGDCNGRCGCWSGACRSGPGEPRMTLHRSSAGAAGLPWALRGPLSWKGPRGRPPKTGPQSVVVLRGPVVPCPAH